MLNGPLGNWRLIDGQGYLAVNPKTGTFPQTLVAKKDPEVSQRKLVFEYLGKSAYRFGKKWPLGQAYTFSFETKK